MSWQLVSFALVAAALAAAFWWYERTRPPAKVVAVVATLAALAALGRDAFAAIPDVKPITAIVLVSGIAFGAGPGFAVGAIAGLLSNVALGQGPWTPWQMLGWGVVGLLGAALGRVGGRRLHPLALALACAVAAEAFNLIVDLYTWTNTGAHTLAGFGAVLAVAAAFDVTHVVASFAFGLAFGAALLRMLLRVRGRLEVSWRPLQTPTALLVAVVAAVGLAGVMPRPRPALAAARIDVAPDPGHLAALRPDLTPDLARLASARPDLSPEISYLVSAQNADGGFGAARGQRSSELYSAWAAIGLAAAGRDPLGVRRGGRSVLDALRGEAGTLEGAGDVERTILALRACGASVRALAGRDPVAELLRARAANGSFGRLVNLTAFAVFALRAAGYASGNPVVRDAGRWIAGQQNADGGFGFAGGGGSSDVDDTAAALQALVDAGVRGRAPARAVAFVVRAQNPDGGFPQQVGGGSNAQSTAWAIQGLVAAGRDVGRVTRAGSRSPLGYLESLVGPDGSVRYSRTSAQTPVWVTAQALAALALEPLPVGPVARRAAASQPASTSASSAPTAAPASPRAGEGTAGRGPHAGSAARAPVAPGQARQAARMQSSLDTVARATGAVLAVLLAPIRGSG